jgi:hypothetical protein
MNTVNAAVEVERSMDPSRLRRALRQWWVVMTALLLAIFFLEAVFAGAMLSGVGWARRAHALTAAVLIASTLAAGVVSMATLRRIPNGPRLSLILLSLPVVAFLQAGVGAMTAKGANLAWIHVPLGVALVGLAAQALATARKLGAD